MSDTGNIQYPFEIAGDSYLDDEERILRLFLLGRLSSTRSRFKLLPSGWGDHKRRLPDIRKGRKMLS